MSQDSVISASEACTKLDITLFTLNLRVAQGHLTPVEGVADHYLLSEVEKLAGYNVSIKKVMRQLDLSRLEVLSCVAQGEHLTTVYFGAHRYFRQEEVDTLHALLLRLYRVTTAARILRTRVPVVLKAAAKRHLELVTIGTQTYLFRKDIEKFIGLHRLYRPSQVAARLNVSARKVVKLSDAGYLGYKETICGGHRYSEEDVRAYLSVFGKSKECR